jgi:probable rRNA maturation factor
VRGTLEVCNRQRARKVQLRELKMIAERFLKNFAPDKECELAIHLVDTPEIQRLNETWLRHAGSTDVITFDYHDPEQPQRLAGDIFICVHEAVVQAKQFGTSWQSEVVRYIVHGILHLSGLDDRTPQERRKMKQAENHWMKVLSVLSSEFDFRNRL